MKARRIVYSLTAQRDLDTLREYIADQGREALGDPYVDRIIACCDGLETFSNRGRLLPSGSRKLVFKRRCTIVYRVFADHVLIQAVYYAGRSGLYD